MSNKNYDSEGEIAKMLLKFIELYCEGKLNFEEIEISEGALEVKYTINEAQ